ncbi:MAG: hypothetical protein M3261_03465 [Thermoproteota archaeon]|nr:hypothetical protein [Thermoproteota archaeon]
MKEISDYFSQNYYFSKIEFSRGGRSVKPWKNLTISYEKSQWHDVYEALLLTGDEIIKQVLKLPIKGF